MPSLGGEARRVVLGIEPCKERGAHDSEIVAARNWHQVLQANRLAARFDAALVVTGPGAAEARLEQIVRRQRLEARSEHSLRADQRPGHGRLEVVVRDALRDAPEVREGPHVRVQEAGLVLTRVQPGEVAARMHQAHHEHPDLDHRARELDEHLEEVDFRQIAGRIDERHEHLAAPALPLGDGLLDHRDADREPLLEQHPVQPSRRQPLLAAGPLRRLGQQRLQPGPGLLPDRATARDPLYPRRRRLQQVPLHRVARDAHFPGYTPGRQAFHQHFVPDYVNLIHPQHPPRGRTRVVGAGWISF